MTCSPPSSAPSERGSGASPSSQRRLLARDHAAPEPTLALPKASSLRCGRVRPLAWCSRPRSSAGLPEEALAVSSQVTLPRLGQGMESGTIVRWLKAEGDSVVKGEPLYELDTEKVTQEVEAEASGIVLRILAGEGEEIEVGKAIAVIGEPGEEVPVA